MAYVIQRWTLLGPFFAKIRALFSNFKKGNGRPSSFSHSRLGRYKRGRGLISLSCNMLFVTRSSSLRTSINPFIPNATFLYLLKISESLRFSDVFRGREREFGNEWVKKSTYFQKYIRLKKFMTWMSNSLRAIYLKINGKNWLKSTFSRFESTLARKKKKKK